MFGNSTNFENKLQALAVNQEKIFEATGSLEQLVSKQTDILTQVKERLVLQPPESNEQAQLFDKMYEELVAYKRGEQITWRRQLLQEVVDCYNFIESTLQQIVDSGSSKALSKESPLVDNNQAENHEFDSTQPLSLSPKEAVGHDTAETAPTQQGETLPMESDVSSPDEIVERDMAETDIAQQDEESPTDGKEECTDETDVAPQDGVLPEDSDCDLSSTEDGTDGNPAEIPIEQPSHNDFSHTATLSEQDDDNDKTDEKIHQLLNAVNIMLLDTLERYQVYPMTEAHYQQPKYVRVIDTQPTTDPSQDKQIWKCYKQGFLHEEYVLRRADISVYQYVKPIMNQQETEV